MIQPLLAAALIAAAFASSPARAESADRAKPIEISANRFNGDQVNQVAVYTGAVELHQGTLEILGDRLEVRISPDGYRSVIINGSPLKMKEKRDNKNPAIDEWVYATSLKATYNERDDVVTLTDRARLDRAENGVIKDTTTGTKIVYNLRNSTSLIEGGTVPGQKTRVSTIFAPRNSKGKDSGAAPSPAPAAPMKGATRLTKE